MLGLSRRTRPPAAAEERASFTLQQLAMAMGASSPSLPSVSSVDEAMRNAAVWACIGVKARGIAQLPVDVVRYEGRTRVPLPLPPVIGRPSGVVGRRAWTHQVAWSMFTDGNVFGLVVDERGNLPSQIELVDPGTVRQRRVVDGVRQATIDGVTHQAWPFGDLWHVPGEMLAAGSPFALSPITYASRSIGTSLKAEDFGGQFFTEGGVPAAILAPEKDPGDEGAKRLKAAFLAATRGSREPVVLPQSTKYERIQVDPSDSQFIDLMRFEVEQVCRFFGVPPAMVYAAVSGQNVTYANVTDADLHYLKHTLSYPIDLLEDALSDLLPAPRVVRFNRDAILRADTIRRYQAHEIALRNRFRTINEVRTIEDEPAFDGDEFDEPIPSATAGTPSQDGDQHD